MTKGGNDNDSATWGAEALPINVVLHRLFAIPWANYHFAKEATEADSGRFVALGSDEDRRLEAYERANGELEVALRSLMEGQGSERWELWGRLESPIKDAQYIPPSALWPQGALRIDFEAGKADGQGVPLFDLRLRRRTMPAIQEDARETAKPTAVDTIYTGAAGRPTASHMVLDEAKRRIDEDRGIVQFGKLGWFAREQLWPWYNAERLRHTDPWPPMTAKTIENTIRGYWHSKLPIRPRNCP